MNAPQMTPEDSGAAWKASVHARMIGVTPGYAYQNHDEIEDQLRNRDADYDKGFAYAAETGFEETPLGMLIRGKEADPFESSNVFERGVHNLVSFATDPVVMVPIVVGALADIAVPGAAIAGFVGGSALDAGLRKWMMENYEEGDTKSFGELADRAGDALWSATKGALGAEAFSVAGDIPVPGMIAEKPLASIAMKGMYQASAMTLAGSLLDQRMPRLRDFEDSALMVVPLNLATGGLMLGKGESKQALMDVYAKNGTTPQESADKLAAQPPVKPDPAPGLKSAINFGESFAEADENESHSDLASRVLSQKPVEMAELEADPKLADKVLQNPEIHEQAVIDRARTLKKEAIESGEPITAEAQQRGPQTIDQLYNRGEMKSGRGFVTPDGKFLDRNAAKRWVKENEPEVYKMWSDIAGGDKEELHAEDYGQARERVAGRNVAEGAADFDSMEQELARFFAGGRATLNGIKAGLKGADYGESALRTLLVGPHNMFVTEAAQLVGRLRKLEPDVVHQRAISFMRDYRKNPDALRSSIPEIKAGSNENLKQYIPSMERALEPTPEMMAADKMLTEYFTKALDRARQLGIMDSSIDPARYSPRMFVKAMDKGAKGFGGSKFTEKTPHAIQREYLNLLDPLKSGDFEARTFNAFDELAIYGDRHAIAVSTKLFTTELRNTALGVEGTEDSHPEGWETLRGSGGLYVPKVVSDALAPLLERGGKPSAVAKFLHVQQVTKAIELGLSLFHIKTMGITAMNNMSVDGYVRAMHSDNSSPDFEAQERHHALYGLTTTKTGPEYEAYKGMNPSDIPTGFGRLTNLPIIKQVDGFAKYITKTTFDVIQRKFKVTDMSAQEAAWVAKHPEATNQEYGSAMRSIAKEMNAAYGGLNWDVMGVSKSMRDMYRMFLLAPDWTFSNIVNAKYAFQGGPAGSAARMFFVKSFATGFAMTAGMSLAIGGKYDPTDIRHIDQVYLGKDKDGKEMYVNLFFAGAPKDAMTWVKKSMSDTPVAGTAEFVVNKAAPVIGTVGHMAMNVEYGGKPIYKKADSFGKKLADQSEYAAERLAPISAVSAVETVENALKDPNKEYSYKDLLELAGDAMGSQVIREGIKTGNAGKGVLPGAGRGGGFHLPGVGRGNSGMRLPGQRR
jgi:hypothetical protein